ncbi:hypothetical protein P0D88_15350 [Paraburkholderia sp. RL18-103-BIB-C]|jgi:hypothetical protein|uniref:hypothetical protein n=1 Tax=unclassified Paraburkholderia TaxID=2615204 RepID=UPI0038BB71B5
MTTHHLTVTAGPGALHVVAVWKGLRSCGARITTLRVQVKPSESIEMLTVQVDGVSLDALQKVVATLNNLPCSMKTALVLTDGDASTSATAKT